MKSLDLRLVDKDDEPVVEALSLAVEAEAESPVQPPRVFSRLIAAPAGWPWEQVRGAQLAARHEAPLPIELVYLQLKRLTPWRPSQSASFAACYVRMADVEERLDTQVDLDGQKIRVVFEPPQVQARRARWSLMVGAGAAALAALLVVSVAGALVARGRAEEQLAAMEHDASVKLRRAEAAQRARREAAALAAISPGERPGAAVVYLAWAMAARDPDARIEAWRWDHGVSSVRARGEASPFNDPARSVTREGPAGRGANVWRIEPREAAR